MCRLKYAVLAGSARVALECSTKMCWDECGTQWRFQPLGQLCGRRRSADQHSGKEPLIGSVSQHRSTKGPRTERRGRRYSCCAALAPNVAAIQAFRTITVSSSRAEFLCCSARHSFTVVSRSVCCSVPRQFRSGLVSACPVKEPTSGRDVPFAAGATYERFQVE